MPRVLKISDARLVDAELMLRCNIGQSIEALIVFARARQGIGTRAGVAVMAVAAHKQILFTLHTQTAAAIQIFRYSGIRNAGFKWQESEVSDLDLIHM